MNARRFVSARHALLLLSLLLAFGAAACDSSDSDSKKDSSPSKESTTSNTDEATSDTTSTEVSGSSTAGGAKQWDSPPPMTINKSGKYTALVKTTKGDFTIDILPQQGPIAANNFVFLAKQGFYTDVPIHRIVTGFMIQTGDPTGTGSGGPGYAIKDDPVKIPYTRGVVAMANAGPDTGGSQFFVMHKDYNLPPDYSIFGKVTKGLDTIDALADTPVQDNGQGEISSPTEKVELISVTISGG
jgi:peptidylprolyl isomerase